MSIEKIILLFLLYISMLATIGLVVKIMQVWDEIYEKFKYTVNRITL